MENYERRGLRERPGIEPGLSCLAALSTEPLEYWWGHGYSVFILFFLFG